MAGYLRASDSQYRDMERLCRALTDIHLSDEDTAKFVAQLCRTLHQMMVRKGKRFSPAPPRIWFRGFNQSGVSCGGRINLSHTPSIYLIIHEMAHETHGRIRALVPPPKYDHGLAEHHGIEYIKNLQFLRDLVLKRAVFKKYLASEHKQAVSPERKRVPVVALNEDGKTFTVRIKPTLQGEFDYKICESEYEDLNWLIELYRNAPRRRRGSVTLRMTYLQLHVLSGEVDYFYCQDDEPSLCRSIREFDDDYMNIVGSFERKARAV